MAIDEAHAGTGSGARDFLSVNRHRYQYTSTLERWRKHTHTQRAMEWCLPQRKVLEKCAYVPGCRFVETRKRVDRQLDGLRSIAAVCVKKTRMGKGG